MQDTFLADIPHTNLTIIVASSKEVLIVRTKLDVLNLNFFVKLDRRRLWVFTYVPKENVAVHRPTQKEVWIVK